MTPVRDNRWPALNSVALPVAPRPAPPVSKYPRFLSPAKKRAGEREWWIISAIDGPELLCTEVLRHARANPGDARVPEALYRCIGAVHYGPASEHCNQLAESAFRLLHRRYADSEWAGANRFWYRGGGSPSSLAASFESYTPSVAAVGAP